MTLDIRINSQSLREVLAGPPKINDPLNAVCRTLNVKVQATEGLVNYNGQPIELWYGGRPWYFGFMFRRDVDATGSTEYVAYDPLYYWKKNPDDYYFTNRTANQIFRELAAKVGTKVKTLANTGVVFPHLYYPGAEPDKISVDVLARTAKQAGKNYWYRYEPDGLVLFERVVPQLIWAFQVGVNLEGARRTESIEETATVVKLVNRETGKTVVRYNSDAIKNYGNLVHFKEVDKDAADTMERQAQALLKQLGKVKVTSSIAGINPYRTMPQLYSGDVIYVEEERTGLIGAYHIRNITQTFESDNLVTLGIDVQAAPSIPTLQYENAAEPKDQGTEGGGEGVSTDPEYSEEMQKVIEQYGLSGAKDEGGP